MSYISKIDCGSILREKKLKEISYYEVIQSKFKSRNNVIRICNQCFAETEICHSVHIILATTDIGRSAYE